MQKNLHDLPRDWKEKMLSMYKNGASDTEIRADLGITYRLWEHLKLTDSEFEEMVLLGRTLAQAWWMTQGRTNLENKSFNAALYNINMQNRFGWNDKTSQKTYGGEEEETYDSEEDIDQELEALQNATATH